MANNYNSIYDIKDFILNDITPKYFNVPDISLVNVGLYGLINDISATTAEDVMRVTSRYITETIPGQSKLPEFIYANAANYGINDIFATCAKCQALLFIKESDVLNGGTGKENTRYTEYKISSDLIVYIDNVPFSLPNDIKIKSTFYNGNYNHRCYWDSTFKNSTVESDLPYIKSAKTKINGEGDTYIVMAVTLHQYERITTVESITSNTTLNIPYVDITFNNYLCNFEVLYKTPEGVTEQLAKVLNTGAPLTSPFVYYEMIDETTIRLSFSNDDRYFTPDYGVELEIMTYECLGEKGSFPVYSGDNIYVSQNVSDDDLGSPNINPMYCNMISDSVNGKNTMSLDEMKQLTTRYQVTVDSLTTDNDLAVYFDTYMNLYKTSAKIVTIRDDFANRIKSCYIRLRDDDNIFPTNTVNLGITLDKLTNEYNPSDDKIIIPAGTRIGYLGNSIDDCIIVNDDEVDDNEIYYSTLGLMVVDKDENTVGLYMNSIDKTVPLLYEYVNDNSLFQFIAKKLTVTRDSIGGDTGYKFTLILTPTDLSLMDTSLEPLEPLDDEEDDYSGDIDDDTEEENDDTEVVLDISKLKVILFVDTLGGHYIELNYEQGDLLEDGGYTFSTTITTDDIVNSKNISLTNLTYCPNQLVQDCYTSMENPPIHILVAYDEGTNPGHTYKGKIDGIDTYTMCNIYKPDTDSLYFAYPLTLIRPVLSFLPDDSNEHGFGIDIKNLPVVGYDFVQDPNNISKLLDRLNSEHERLAEAKITSNFAIWLRFFNTYGRSRVFTVTSGALLNRVNCSLSLSIKFYDAVIPEDYLDEIKLTIKDYIESVNSSDIDTNLGINSIKLSLISKLVHDSYDSIISYVVMGSLNGYDSNIQTIIMDKDLNAKENMNLFPEFLTIDINDIDITIL